MEQNVRFARLLFAGCGQQLLHHQERQRGLAVAERAVHHLLHRLGKRHPQCADELILIRMRLSSVQPRRQVEVDALVAEAGGRLQHGQLAPVVGGQPGFLAQLTLGADERVFIHPIELARRNFQRQAANGDAMLADENHVAVIIQRDNARRAGVDDCIAFAVADAREFDRTTDRGVIVREARFEGVQTGGKYSVSFRFSKDLPGFIQCVVIKVNTDPDEQDDTIIFSPDPTIEGDGFDIAQPQGYIPGDSWTRSYKLAAMAPLKTAELRFGEQTYDLMMSDAPAEGITVVRDNDLSLTVTLSEAFLAGCPAGSHSASFRIADTKDAEATAASELRVQGILPVGKEDYDLWANTVTLRAVVVDPNVSAVTFGLKNGESWLETEGTADGNGCYTATYRPEWTESTNEAGLKVYTPEPGKEGITAGNDYELRSMIGDRTYSASLTTPAGDTIYNAGMDYWTTYNVTGSSITGGTVPYPNENSSTVFWVGGNNAQTNALCTGVNVNDNDDSDKCAQLKPDEKFRIFAAGNLFTGTFDCGTGFTDTFGYARFGVQYTFTARPRALRLRYKATVTNITNTGNSGLTTNDIDSARVFVCVIDWTGRHAVKSGASSDESTFWDPETKSLFNEGPILGYSSKKLGKSTEGWETMELPLLWYDKDKAPTAGNYSLVISCATSYKGDYVTGSTSNLLCVENFEWVY